MDFNAQKKAIRRTALHILEGKETIQDLEAQLMDTSEQKDRDIDSVAYMISELECALKCKLPTTFHIDGMVIDRSAGENSIVVFEATDLKQIIESLPLNPKP